jgi:hypothetical protein
MMTAFTCPLRPWTSLVYSQASSLEIDSVQCGNGIVGCVLGYLHETKTFVGNDPDTCRTIVCE